MSLTAKLHAQNESKNMLSHPFYRDWMEGKLTMNQLRNYSIGYIPFVDAFPRMVSATHSLCDDAKGRRVLLENLMDEEGVTHSAPHPQLWRDFAAGIGADTQKNELESDLHETFLNLCRSSYEEGLGALYAYEHQIPQIAEAKIKGLADNYGITDEATLKFFAVHQKADVYHSQACAELIDAMSAEQGEKVLAAAKKASDALWDFLSKAHVH